MNRRAKLAAVCFLVGGIGLGIGTAGCGSDSPQERQNDLNEQDSPYGKWHFTLTTTSGGAVDCYMIGGAHGGPTCDWVGYHEKLDKK
jgi:hypothetical protein